MEINVMKALVLEKYNKLVYKEMPEPHAGPDDVLVQVKASGICGSDVHGMDGSTGRRVPPLIMGHEAAGIIAQVGSNVKNYQPGQRVTFDSTVYCGKCFFCRRGDINLCDHRRVLVRGDYPACLNMIARGAINVDALISATAPLSDGARWFERLYGKDKGLMKVVLTP